MRFLYLFIIGVFILSSCDNVTNNEQKTDSGVENSSAGSNVESTMHHGKTLEVIQTTSYTYLKLDENGSEVWIAVKKIDANVGDEYYYANSMEMKDFKSTELNRVFPSVFFVQNISKTPMDESQSASKTGANANPQVRDESLNVEHKNGEITIEELFKNRDKYADKKVKVIGKITKVNNAIMNKNWVHIQDGTAFNDNYDLTITTQEKCEVGEMISFEGTIYLNKDFGAGYSYELIMEDAVKQ